MYILLHTANRNMVKCSQRQLTFKSDVQAPPKWKNRNQLIGNQKMHTGAVPIRDPPRAGLRVKTLLVICTRSGETAEIGRADPWPTGSRSCKHGCTLLSSFAMEAAKYNRRCLHFFIGVVNKQCLFGITIGLSLV